MPKHVLGRQCLRVVLKVLKGLGQEGVEVEAAVIFTAAKQVLGGVQVSLLNKPAGNSNLNTMPR